jgi:hypothetical protein
MDHCIGFKEKTQFFAEKVKIRLKLVKQVSKTLFRNFQSPSKASSFVQDAKKCFNNWTAQLSSGCAPKPHNVEMQFKLPLGRIQLTNCAFEKPSWESISFAIMYVKLGRVDLS